MTATVTLKITSDTSTLRADIGKTKQAVESLAPAASAAGNVASQSFEKASNAAKKANDSTSALAKGFSEFKKLLAGLGAIAVVKQLTSMADEYANISAKLKLVTSGTDQFNNAQNRVFEIAQRTSNGLAETATLATKITRIFLGMGESNEVALNKGLQLTETLQKSLAISGATAAEASSLVLQLGQALQSGSLNGDEFRSVMENGGRVIQALTEYTGKSVAELRKMSEQHKITAGVVTAALQASADKINQEFSKVPITIERSFTQLRNSMVQFIGQSDQAAGASKAIAGVIVLLSQNLSLVANAVGLVGTVFAVKYVVGLVTAATASQLLLTKQIQLTATELLGAKAAETLALAQVAKARAMSLGLGPTVQLTAAESALSAAQARTATAMAASTAAAAAKTGVIARLGGSLLALAGGPIGVAILALGGLAVAYLALREREAEQQREFDAGIAKMKEVATTAEILHDRLTDLSNVKPPPIEEVLQGFSAAATLATQKQDELNNKRRELINIESEINRVSTSTNDALAIQLLSLVPKAENLKKQVAQLGQELVGLQAPTNQLSGDLAQRFAPALDNVATALDRIRNASSLGEAFSEIKTGITGFLAGIDKIKSADKEFQSTLEQLGQKTKSVTEELKTAGKTQIQLAKDFAKAALESAKAANIPQGQLNTLKKQLDLYVANTSQVDKLKNAHKAAAEAQREATKAERLHDQQARELERTLEAQKKATESLSNLLEQQAEAINGPVRKAMVEHEKVMRQIEDISKALLAQGPPTIDVQKQITDAINNENQANEKRLSLAREREDVYGRTLRQLDEEKAALLLSGDAARQYEIVTRALNEAKEIGKPFSDEQINQLKTEVSERLKAIQVIQNQKSVQQEYQNIVAGGLGDIGKSIADFATGSIKKWSDFGKSLKDTAKQFIADLIQQFLKLKFINPILNSIFKAGLPTFASGAAGATGTGGAAGGLGGIGGLAGGITQGGGALGGLLSGTFGSIGGILSGIGGSLGGFGAGLTIAGNAGLLAAGKFGIASLAAGNFAVGLGSLIPVVGAIGAGLAIVNKITGGGLFGTKYKATGASNTTFDLSGGISTLNEEKKKKAFFGGTKTRYVAGQVDPEAQKAFNDFLTGLKDLGTQASAALGTTTVDIVSGSFKQVFDSKGKLKDEFSTVLGKVYKESLEDFQKRAQAETIIAQVTQSAPEASAIADPFRANAAKLFDVAQLMLAAQIDITKGNALLSDSLADTVKFVTDNALANETLVQTYARLQGATVLLQQATDLMGINLGKSKEEFIVFAAEIAKAAGGLDQATQLWNGFFSNFFTQSEIAAIQLPKILENAAKELADIGLDSGINKDEFKQQFLELFPTLTPEQIVQWLQAGNALDAATKAQDAYNQSLGVTAQTQDQYNQTLAEQDQALLIAQNEYSNFINSIAKDAGLITPYADAMAQAEQWRIDAIQKANELAIAAGLASAAESDLATIELRSVQLREEANAALLRSQADYSKMVNDLRQEAGGGSAFVSQISDIRAWEAETVNALNNTARAAGLQAAAEEDLALVHTIAANRVSAAVQQLLNETNSLIDQLYGSGAGGGQSSLDTFSSGASSGFGDVSSSIDDVFEKWQRGLKAVKEFLDKILLDTKLTTLTPEQQLNEAQNQFQTALLAAQGGDADALAKLPDLANTLLTLGRDFFSSGDQYTALFNGVRDALQGLPEGSPLASVASTSGGGGTFSSYLDQRDVRVADQEAAHRAELAQQLAEHLRDLAGALNKPVLELIASMGVNLNLLAADLGINLQTITGESVKQLADLASTLGIRLGDLTTGLGLNLTDLGAGLTELTTALGIDFDNLTGQQITSLAKLANDLGLSLTEITTATGHNLTDLSVGVKQLTDSLGIDLSNLTISSTNQLAQLAQSMGVNLSELSQSVGIDLGSLADSQSLLNQSLSSTIETLPQGQRDQLAPLLDAITNATNEADANAAIKALEDATNGLPAEQRDLLAPYFENVFPASASSQLDYLQGLYSYAQSQLNEAAFANLWLSGIKEGIDKIGAGQDLPGFAVGTSYVPQNMAANIHQGEKIIDSASSSILSKYGIQVKAIPLAIPNSGESTGMLNALRAVQEELKAIREGQTKDTTTSSTKMEKLIVGFDNMVKATDNQTREISRVNSRVKV